MTGGSGFIGTNLIDFLSHSEQVESILSLDIKQPKLISERCVHRTCDINDFMQLAEEVRIFKPTHIVNLAADTGISASKGYDEFKTNIQGVENVIRICREVRSIKRVVFASTVLVNRLGKEQVRDEDYDAETPYGKSKVDGEIVVRKNHDIPWVIIRPISVWGPWNEEPYLQFCRAIKKGYYFNIKERESVRSASFVGNAARQIMSLLITDADSVIHKTFYLGDRERISLKRMSILIRELVECNRNAKVAELPYSLVKVIAKFGDVLLAFGLKAPLNSYRLKNISMSYEYNTKPINDLNQFEEIPWEEGVKEMVSWYKRSCLGSK